MDLVRPLDSFTSDDVAIAGGKGANLGELIGAGFDVPAGFVVTTSGYDAYVCLLYTSPSPRDGLLSRMPSSA